MKIRSVRHRGLKRLLERDDPSGLPQAYLTKIADIAAFPRRIPRVDALRTVPAWKVHTLSGDRKGTWSVSVSRNWRITFRIDDGEIADLDFEDYH